jgi:hypothetical protein
MTVVMEIATSILMDSYDPNIHTMTYISAFARHTWGHPTGFLISLVSFISRSLIFILRSIIHSTI